MASVSTSPVGMDALALDTFRSNSYSQGEFLRRHADIDIKVLLERLEDLGRRTSGQLLDQVLTDYHAFFNLADKLDGDIERNLVKAVGEIRGKVHVCGCQNVVLHRANTYRCRNGSKFEDQEIARTLAALQDLCAQRTTAHEHKVCMAAHCCYYNKLDNTPASLVAKQHVQSLCLLMKQ